MNHKVVIYLLFSLFVLVLSYESQSYHAALAHHQEVGEEEAIRLRILANSDAIKDQMVKRNIRDVVNGQITEWVTGLDDLDDAKQMIRENLPKIDRMVESELAALGLEQDYTVSFTQAQFPTKLYGNIVYQAGIYDTVLITLGEGNGENWWCVLFPPLCFLDMASGDAVDASDEEETVEEEVEEEQDDVVVSLFIVELFSSIIERIFGTAS
ncbi:stage II sporulation protein R [Halalkalibacterium halodurans]|uniref:stage II sporulation protein R n=1 Tax=Halalkalibacterium halodurans TaxID=86665 RepID=UPI002E1C18F8|nr:stage II sporulation protein R [Halalkalibacterium halodurans]MED4163309.1 stage II sporulation protein R [Halalkalibacterium halodurans]